MNAANAIAEGYILFEIAGTTYGVSSRSVQQIEMIEHVTPLPNAPDFVEGVVFTRGEAIPALDLRARFGFSKTERTTRSRLIVTSQNGRVVGLIVDSAREFISIPEDAIQPPPSGLGDLSGKYLKGVATVGDRIMLIIDLGELLNAGHDGGAALRIKENS